MALIASQSAIPRFGPLCQAYLPWTVIAFQILTWNCTVHNTCTPHLASDSTVLTVVFTSSCSLSFTLRGRSIDFADTFKKFKFPATLPMSLHNLAKPGGSFNKILPMPTLNEW